MKTQSTVLLFMDDDSQPIGEFPAPIAFDLDTRRLVDGRHVLKVVSKDSVGKEGIRLIPFTVRNGPAIAIEGLTEEDVVEGTLPLMINAYSKGDQKSFMLTGSETPQSIPQWIIVVMIVLAAWAVYFITTSLAVKL
jgi:hypothetical protein